MSFWCSLMTIKYETVVGYLSISFSILSKYRYGHWFIRGEPGAIHPSPPTHTHTKIRGGGGGKHCLNVVLIFHKFSHYQFSFSVASVSLLFSSYSLPRPYPDILDSLHHKAIIICQSKVSSNFKKPNIPFVLYEISICNPMCKNHPIVSWWPDICIYTMYYVNIVPRLCTRIGYCHLYQAYSVN